MPSLPHVLAQDWLQIIGHLFIKFERISFAYYFNCTSQLSFSPDIKYEPKLSIADSTQKPLSKSRYSEYRVMSLSAIQLGLTKELNDCFKALILKEETWLSRKLKHIHEGSKHSYVCMLHITLRLIVLCSENVDRKLIVAMMSLFTDHYGPNSPLKDKNQDRLNLFTYLMLCYWNVHGKHFLKVLIESVLHACDGHSLDSCDPNEDLFQVRFKET